MSSKFRARSSGSRGSTKRRWPFIPPTIRDPKVPISGILLCVQAATRESLQKFADWLARRGRSEGTQVQYVRLIRGLSRRKDPLRALTDKERSPAYRHTMATALRSWSKFVGDQELRTALDEIRLPPLIRQSVRTPLPKEEWFEVIEKLRADESMDPFLRAALEIIMIRGIRCSDCLRITKGGIRRALKTGRLKFVAKREKTTEFSAAVIREPLEVLSRMEGDDSTPLYTCLTQGKMTTAARRVRQELSDFARRQGYGKSEVFCHRFRHSYANAFLEEMKGDPRAVFLLQDQMDWSSPNTARSYVKHGERAELDAIEGKMFERRKKKM